MRFNKNIQPYLIFLKKINFGFLKSIFFISSLLYFCVYFFDNIDQISFDINLERDGINLFLSFLFCILSIYLNAYAWKYIVRWFGKEFKSNNLVSFYVLTNILKNTKIDFLKEFQIWLITNVKSHFQFSNALNFLLDSFIIFLIS